MPRIITGPGTNASTHMIAGRASKLNSRLIHGALTDQYAMTCKIESIVGPGSFVVLRVSGRIDGTHVEALRDLVEKGKTPAKQLAIDLTEVTLVSREAVDVLTFAEANGIELRNCPAYVREWVSRETNRGIT